MDKDKFHTHYTIFNAGTLIFFIDDIIDFHFSSIERKTFKLLSLNL